MQFYNVPLYRITIDNNCMPVLNISNCCKVVVSKKSQDTVMEPVTKELIFIQRKKDYERGMTIVNNKQIKKQGFQLIVCEDDLSDENIITKEELINWINEFGGTMFEYIHRQIVISDIKSSYKKSKIMNKKMKRNK